MQTCQRTVGVCHGVTIISGVLAAPSHSSYQVSALLTIRHLHRKRSSPDVSPMTHIVEQRQKVWRFSYCEYLNALSENQRPSVEEQV